MAEKKRYALDECTIDIYLQKSLKFLYPLLKISSRETKLPIQTYLAWKGEVGINDYKLLCLYELREDVEFKQFERKVLQGHELFEDFKEAEDNKGVYIFNLKKYKEDVFQFLKGRYSFMSEDTKNIILGFYDLNKYSREYMDSFLNPGKRISTDPGNNDTYFTRYAKLLNISEERLLETGELYDRFDRTKETLTLNILESKILTQ